MNLYEAAKQMEKEGEDQYRQLAATAQDKGLQRIFTVLADNEVKHYQVIEEMEKKATRPFEVDLMVEDVKAVFRGMQERASQFSSDTPQELVYAKALDGEKKAVAFYTELLAQAQTDAEKAAIEGIIKEEKQHAVLLENMIDFIRAPKMWLENAEFNNMEAY